MRTLCGEGKVTLEEIAFLKDQDCKIGLVIRDLTEAKVSGNNGTEDALKAVEAAKEFGVPENKGMTLFAEIKPLWSVNHNWMISFAKTVLVHGYVPAFIGNTDSSKNFNFDRRCSHYAEATRDFDYFGVVLMATEPKCDKMSTEWAPHCPSALEPENIAFWSCGTTTFDLIQVEDVYAKDEKIIDNLW